MKQTPRRLATTIVAGIAILGLGAAPALADSQAHRDPRGDVSNLSSPKVAPKPGIDLVRSANTYEGSTLEMNVTSVNLLRKGYGVVWIISTPDNTYQLVFDHTGRKPVTSFQGGGASRWSPARALDRGTPPPTCDGVKGKADGDAVLASVPRSCLGGADEVRVAAVIIQPDSGGGAKVDDARRKGFDPSDGPKFGPTLERN